MFAAVLFFKLEAMTMCLCARAQVCEAGRQHQPQRLLQPVAGLARQSDHERVFNSLACSIGLCYTVLFLVQSCDSCCFCAFSEPCLLPPPPQPGTDVSQRVIDMVTVSAEGPAPVPELTPAVLKGFNATHARMAAIAAQAQASACLLLLVVCLRWCFFIVCVRTY